ncbi:hypothetical protein FHT91_002183 [Rhizobium sp. BK347]|nr:hypothetical protein [Rhizobium sp. BK252]MBB3401527.1 hypothetical protein [Rhizobium sp. BK289]MBB3414528.1 hypothetical protein [Rhizobium sp. BK284]MBB3482417.1 hypothetical protein [Rhizobium sp. BK347]
MSPSLPGLPISTEWLAAHLHAIDFKGIMNPGTILPA